MALSNKKTVMAIVSESTEATPVLPSAAGDYLALQEGFDMSPSFETLDNAEVTGTIANSKPINGLEAPTGSISHYAVASGTEGVESEYGLLIEAALGGKTVASTEYNTIAGSTAGTAAARGTVVVDSGEGVNFERGQALLIKDGTNGRSIRNVFSVATDTLNLGFNLANAPASGVNTGKAILYKPADESHPTFTAWMYRANGGAIEAMAGTRVTEMSIEATAGELVNMNFSLEGVKYYFDPIEIGADDIYIDWTDDAGTFAATVTAQVYQDPHALADAIASAMNDLTTETITCTYSDSTGKFTIATSTSAVLSLLWNTGTNTANTIGDAIGFSVAADDTLATTYTSDTAMSWAAPQTPSYDGQSPIVAKNNEVLIGEFSDLTCVNPSSVTVNYSGTKSNILSVCSSSGVSGSIISAREATIEFSAILNQHDADKFKRLRAGTNTNFMWNFGEKSGGNWVEGKCMNVYSPSCVVTEMNLEDQDGLVAINVTLATYVSGGLGELYINHI